jgi:uncharacterized protein YkwD
MIFHRFGAAACAAGFALLALISAVSAAGDPPPPPEDGITSAEQEALLSLHNSYRGQHCVPALTWSAELAASAQAWASKCRIGHGPRGKVGENLAWGYQRPASHAVDAWYKEVQDYNYARPGFASSTGHFTQVVWRGTTQMGCGAATCLLGSVRYWVCRYSPQGNWAGQFPVNVPKRCK